MFQSRTRPIIISQYEHGRLAGTLAWWWGNEQFARPEMDFAAFVQGVALHDWAYGVIDNIPIFGVTQEQWLAVVSRGADLQFANATTDVVAKLHLRRLLSGREGPGVAELVAQLDGRVAERLPETGRTVNQFLWADAITALCDQLAFDFCFEEPGPGIGQVYAGRDDDQQTAIRYELRPGGELVVDPWPFAPAMIGGTLVGYTCEGYPDRLEPLTVPFFIHGR